MAENSRRLAREQFLASSPWADSKVTPLVPDASFRQYFRLARDGQTTMLMDAPPQHEDIEAFLDITQHLTSLSVRVPEVFKNDIEQGFAIIEDLGDQTFTRLLAHGKEPAGLYRHAVDTLLKIASNPRNIDLDIRRYDGEQMLAEARLFVDWYLPARDTRHLSQTAVEEYLDCWCSIMNDLPPLPDTLVLRDYHVDNLMMVGDKCAVLDYQDALTGSPAYDLVSLLEDARRDVSQTLQTEMLNHYLASRPEIDPASFHKHYIAWGVQRHLKVAGIFTRLWIRDNKPIYLDHLHRVMNLVNRHLHEPIVAPFRHWLDSHSIDSTHREFR